MAIRCAFLLAVLVALAPATAAPRAAEPVDVTPFIAPLPEVGDYKVFVEAGGAWAREDVVEVELVSGGWRVERRYVDAEGDCATVSQWVYPAVETTTDYPSTGPEACPAFVGELAQRARRFALEVRPGRAARFRDRWGLYNFVFPTRYKLQVRQRLAELAPLETPYASHSGAARVESRSRLASFSFSRGFDDSPFGWKRTGWVSTRRLESWFVEGIGLVGEKAVRRSLKRGRQREKVSYEIWLREGVIGGVPYP